MIGGNRFSCERNNFDTIFADAKVMDAFSDA
jgi:hypothetical protein